MPERVNWPPFPRRVGTAALVLAYAMLAVAGVDTVIDQTQHVSTRFGSTTIITIGLIAAIGGAVAAVEALRHRWKSELRAVAGVGAALIVYSVFDWFLVISTFPDKSLRGPAVLTTAWALLILRGAHLYVFSLSTRAAKRLRASSRPVP